MMNTAKKIGVSLLLAASFLGCELDGDKRCDSSQTYAGNDDDGWFCVEDADTEYVNPYADSGIDGLGEWCASDADCAGTQAEYCAIVPGDQSGACAIRDCDAAVNDCPLDLKCCDFPSEGISQGIPDLCMPQDEYDNYDAMVGCHG